MKSVLLILFLSLQWGLRFFAIILCISQGPIWYRNHKRQRAHSYLNRESLMERIINYNRGLE